MSPLLDIEQINDRLDSVQDLINYKHEADLVRQQLQKVPDIEKLLAKIFTYSIQHKIKAVYFEDVNMIKLREFKLIITAFGSIKEKLMPLIK